MQLVRSESLRGFVPLFTQLGGDIEPFLAKHGLHLEQISEEGGLLPYRTFVSMLEDAARLLAAPDFGLRLGLVQDFSVLGPIALAAQDAKNLGEAAQRVSTYLHVYTPALGLGVTPMPGGRDVLMHLEILLNPKPPCAQAVELSLGLASQVLSMLSGGRSKPLEVWLPHAQSHRSSFLNAAFPVMPKFDQTLAGFVLPIEDLNLPILRDDSEVGRIAFEYLQSQFVAKELKLSQKVRAIMPALMLVEQCTNEKVADVLGMQVRQLHRKLEKEGVTYLQVKDDFLQGLAEKYLQQPSLKFRQIASMLGYAEQSGFTRSCQRWFGCSPRAYRQNFKKTI